MILATDHTLIEQADKSWVCAVCGYTILPPEEQPQETIPQETVPQETEPPKKEPHAVGEVIPEETEPAAEEEEPMLLRITKSPVTWVICAALCVGIVTLGIVLTRGNKLPKQ